MSVKPVGDAPVIYTWKCDLCGTETNGAWVPENWDGVSVALMSGGMAQLHVCHECITTSNIVVLLNKVKTTEQ